MAKTQENMPTVDSAADTEAWLTAAASRKYHIDGGQVWSGVAGMLFPLPPLPGFAYLPETVRTAVFHAVSQFVTYRVGQLATGNVAEAVANAITSGVIPAAKSNDAFESHYAADIAERIDSKYGEIAKTATAEEKAARRKAVDATAKKFRSQLFDQAVAAGKAAALNKSGDPNKKPRKAASTVNALELDSL